MKKTNGLRGLIISGMTRQQMIDFIKRRDSFYSGTSFAGHSDEQVRQVALSVDKQVQADRQTRQQLINYIKANDKSWRNQNLDNHSLTALVVIKTEIEIHLANSKRRK